jgi:Protein of unknown function (DUF3616)
MSKYRYGLSLMIIVCISSYAVAQQAPKIIEYPDMCDASAAVAVGDKLFMAASDEDNILRIYKRDEPGQPQRVDLNSFLKLSSSNEEVDIEGSARIGDDVYWIGSHGQNKSGKARPDRQRLFATRVTLENGKVTVTPVGSPYTNLRNELIKAPALQKYNFAAAVKLPVNQANGFNIEGLSATPDGKLLLGFRNPIPKGKALIIPIENPKGMMMGEKAKIGAAIELNLNGRGIRSMEYSEQRGKYLIVGGPYDEKGTFALYSWSGKSQDDAVLIPLPANVFAGLRPEAMFFYPGETKAVQFLSDDGDLPIDGKDCNDGPVAKQKFRAFTVEIP